MATDDGAAEEEASRQWRVTSQLSASSSGIRQVGFAPRQHGLLLCATCDDGLALVWEADQPLAPNTWCLQSKLQVGSARDLGPGAAPQPCVLAWRPFSPNTAPLFVAGMGTAVAIWQYVMELMTWQRVAELEMSCAAEPVTAVHWAPHLGRPQELLAVAHGCTVDVFSMQGDTASPETALLASLEASGPVWKVEFNQLGTCLAAATEGNHITVWRASIAGGWDVMSELQGRPDAGAVDMV